MALDAQAGIAATTAAPGIPRDQEGPTFREPWEAQAFAMAVALHARGVFSWKEWATALAAQIQQAQAAGDADTGRLITGIGWPHWSTWSWRKALRRLQPCIATATPGTTLQAAHRMARRSS
jgi:nitrile hydratase accessory protein